MGLGSKAAKVAAAVAAAAAAVGIAGFGAGGIAAGSWAAGLMSTYGGTVPAGSLCAVLQSVGASGLATSTVVAMEGVAASLAGVAGFVFKRASGDDDDRGAAPVDDDENGAGSGSENSGGLDSTASEVEELLS